MRNIVLASHGELSKGMLNSLQMIVGDEMLKRVRTFSLYPGESACDYAQTLSVEIKSHTEDEYIIVADLLGGSVHTALISLLTHDNVKLFSGMNLSMALEIVMNTQSEVSEESALSMKERVMEGITFMSSKQSWDEESEEF